MGLTALEVRRPSKSSKLGLVSFSFPFPSRCSKAVCVGTAEIEAGSKKTLGGNAVRNAGSYFLGMLDWSFFLIKKDRPFYTSKLKSFQN